VIVLLKRLQIKTKQTSPQPFLFKQRRISNFNKAQKLKSTELAKQRKQDTAFGTKGNIGCLCQCR